MESSPKLSQKQQNSVLLSAILASSMAFIDGTALNVAMPALQRALDLNATELLWVVNAYTLFLAALMLLGGSLGDIYGKKRTFIWGITLFTVFSIVCGFAHNGQILIIGRALQGIGGALMVPGSLSILTASFPQEKRGKAIGTWSMFSAFTTILGPVLGGYLAGEGLWRFIFFINVPLGIASMIILVTQVREPVSTNQRKLDWYGSILITIGLIGLVYGFIQASEVGFDSIWVWICIAIGIANIIGFIIYEAKAKSPMMPLSLFQSSTFSGANAMTFMVYGALGAVLFFVPLNLIQVQNYPETLAGLGILPFGGLIAILARTSGKLTDKVGAKLPLIIGPILTGIGFLGFSLIGITDGFKDFWISFFPVLVIAGIGMGLTVVPLTTAVMNCVSDANSGIASGINNTISRLAGVLTLAIVGSFAIISFQEDLVTYLKLPEAELTGDQVAYMQEEAINLAEAQPNPNWLESEKNTVRHFVKQSFVNTFNFTAVVSAILCFIGAIISWRYVDTKPKQVILE